ncbi:monocarboxylate transporter 12-like isoform X2 [Argopecten irradians]|uniref:monocarboxylate transporter 12-like isoform X2 n=1 Tax=Argopecten irradians TaxID=31199 RepID=UPI0037115D68
MDTVIRPPDGGWGWLVMGAAFVITMIIDGVSFTFGILFPEFLSQYGESKAKTQSLNSVLIGTFLIGPLIGALVKRYGARRLMITGGIVSSVGIFLSTFSPNLDVMILLYGFVGGVGFALLYLPALLMVSMYFDRRRALATGIAVCGSGVGGLVCAPLYEYLLEIYGWQGTLWIISAIVLNAVVCGAVCRPIGERHTRREDHEDDDDMEDENWKQTKSSDCSLFWSSVIDSFDFSLLKNPVFLLYGISTLLAATGFYIPFNFLPVQALDINLSADDGALLISIISISNTVTRVLIGYISHKPFADTVLINSTALFIGGLATCFVSYYTTFTMMAAFSVLFGATIAIFITLMTIILTELLGIRRLASSLGFNMIFMGLGSFIGSPIAGALSDRTGDYVITFYFGGITLGLAGLICFPLRWVARRQKSTEVNESRRYMYSIPMGESSNNVPNSRS